MQIKLTSIFYNLIRFPIRGIMFLVITKYTAPLAEVDLKRAEHISYLKELEKEKKLLLAGRRSPPAGGLLLFAVKTKEELIKILSKDPYEIYKLSTYEIFDFTPGVYSNLIKDYI